MHQVIELRFDQATENSLVKFRADLYSQGLADLPDQGLPHISLASFAASNSAVWKKPLDEFSALSPIKVDFSYVGVFRGQSLLVYLGVTPSPAMRAAHEHIHDYATYAAKEVNAFYLPGNCVFHVSLAYGVVEKNLGQVVDKAIKAQLPKYGTVNRIALTEYFPAQTLYEKMLGS